MTAREILHAANMSARPGFYAGRGATVSDLTEKHLEKIWGLIKEHHGEKAAASFVQMVEAMKKMEATAFINELYSLENAKWKFKQVAGHNGMHIDKNEDGSYNEAQGMAAIFSALGAGSNRDDTPMIRNHFLRCHGVSVKEGRSMFDGRDYYHYMEDVPAYKKK